MGDWCKSGGGYQYLGWGVVTYYWTRPEGAGTRPGGLEDCLSGRLDSFDFHPETALLPDPGDAQLPKNAQVPKSVPPVSRTPALVSN